MNPRKYFKLNTEDATNYYVTIREIQKNKIQFSNKTDRINEEALILCNKRANLEKGDILFSGTGTIGEVAIIKDTPLNWSIKEGIYSLKPILSMINSKFLMYLLSSNGTRNIYLQKIFGGTVKSLSMAELNKLLIPLPPLEEQQRIVDILDRFDKLCNDISEGLPAEIEARQR